MKEQPTSKQKVPELPSELRRAAKISTSGYWAGVLLEAADEIEAARRQDETTEHTALLQEICERHGRASKLLWGPAALPGMMLGPMDADAAHNDRGTLLSLMHLPRPPEKATCEHPVSQTMTTGTRGVWKCRKCGELLHDDPSLNGSEQHSGEPK